MYKVIAYAYNDIQTSIKTTLMSNSEFKEIFLYILLDNCVKTSDKVNNTN